MWNRVEALNWARNKDYQRTAKLVYSLSPVLRDELINFVDDRVIALQTAIAKFEKDRGNSLDIGSDDGFSDVTYHIVGLGKKVWEAAMKNPLLVEKRYHAKYGTKAGYKESFAYCFLELFDTEKKNDSQPVVTNKGVPMCHKCCHGLWAKNIGTSKSVSVQTFKGCSEDTNIDSDNVRKLCPLL